MMWQMMWRLCGRWCGDYVADDVVIMWQMTWRWCFKNVALMWQPSGADVAATWHWCGSHVALAWKPRGAHIAATWRWRGGRWRQPMQFFPRLNFSLYKSITAQPTYIPGTTHIHFSPTNAQQIENRYINPKFQIWPKKDIHHLVETTKYHHITIYITRNNRSP
jgi:hypothetical protein